MPKLKQRFEDVAVSRGKHYASVSVAAVVGWLGHMIATSNTFEQIQTQLNWLFGGAICAYGLWKAIGETIFKNMESLARTRAEHVEELERKLNEEKAAREASERRYQQEIDRVRSEFEKKLVSLQQSFDEQSRRYEQVIFEKAVLEKRIGGAK